MSWSLFAAVLPLLVIAKLVRDRIIYARHGPYPPGPKPKPLIGNMFDFPNEEASEVYMEWGQKYGSDVLYASALGNHVVVLNKWEDAEELLENRSAKYSDRPWIPMVDNMGWNYNIALLGYGESWRYHRKICQQRFHPEALGSYHLVQTRKVEAMLRGLLASPEKFEYHNKMLSVGIPMSTMYGYEVESIDDPCITAADQSIVLGTQLGLPGSSIANIIPLLRHIPAWLPRPPSLNLADEVRRLTNEMQRIPMEYVTKCIKEGTAASSLVSEFLEKKITVGASEKEEKAIENIAYTVYGAASDTTISAIGSFFYYMAKHPNIQKKAQAEIDRIIGSHRLPNLKDRSSLPYIEAIYREVFRSRPPLRINIPHSLSEDDHYKGYYLPKGTSVLANIWAMTHDESLYPDPYTFKPERFLDSNGKLNGDSHVLAYGFGRRVCVGQHVASSTVWLVMVSVLATFDISKAKDEFGNEIEINDEYTTSGMLTHKKPYKCSITPRSVASQKLVEDTAATKGHF